ANSRNPVMSPTPRRPDIASGQLVESWPHLSPSIPEIKPSCSKQMGVVMTEIDSHLKILASPELTWIPGGTFRMGSAKHYPEEAPVHRVTVDGFWIDRTPVTNRDFRRFVNATSYVTLAELAPDPKDYPGALPHMLKAGSLVFAPPKHPVDLRDWSQWW